MNQRLERHERMDWIQWMNLGSACLVALALAIALFAASVWLIHRPMFRLVGVRVEGEGQLGLRHVNVASVRAGALPAIRGNFFTVDLAAVRQAFENVAWVRHARVRRQWPNQLVVSVEEQRVAALWNDDALVNVYGEPFTANVAEAQSEGELPQLNGPDGSARDVLAHYGDFSRDFAHLGLKPVEVTLSPRYAWSMRLDNGTAQGLLVELGRESDAHTLADRINRMLATYPVVTEKWPHVTLIDLRYPNGFALRAEGLKLATPPSPHASVHREPKHVPAHPDRFKT